MTADGVTDESAVVVIVHVSKDNAHGPRASLCAHARTFVSKA